MAIEYTPESNLVSDPAEGGSFSPSNDAELAGAQSFAAQAKLSENAAATSETNSANSATASATSATASSTSATQSANSATASATSATQSATSATASATSATASANSATAAATSETNAGTSATTATTKASEASTSATNAATSETNAGTSATAASNSATAAATSATSASGSATTATTKASEASTSETNAGTSATASATSATASANSATAAATSATNAGTSETAAATSATNAATSATASANSATSSATSATNSSNSATSAATAQTAAESARDAALAAFDSFDDRYLGQKSSDPSTDNDGNTLVAGTLYFNTTTDAMMVYEGSSWVAAYASLSGALIANNNLSDLNNAATARTNLGLGTAATTASTAYATAAQGTTADNALPKSGGAMTGAITTNSTFDGRDVAADGTKLDGIESGATADQTATEIKTAYESNSDTNAFTDADHSKLDGIEASADVTDATNVTAAGALMDSECTSLASVKALNQGVATTDSPTFGGLTVGDGSGSEQILVDAGAGWADLKLNSDATNGGSIYFNDGADAGQIFYYHPDNTMRFHTDATERMRIDGSGKVGIGTSSPSEALHVTNGGLLIDSNIPDAPASGTSGLIVDYHDKQTRFWSRGDATTAGGYAFKILENDGGNQSDAMVIDSSGRVGIGTSSPVTSLHISSGTSGDAKVIIEADTDNNDEGDHPCLRLKQDGGLVSYRFGIGTSDGDTASSNNDLCVTAEGSGSSQMYMVTTGGVQHKFWHAGNDGNGSGLDADLYQGFDQTASGNRWGVMAPVGTDGVMEIGRYIDFHETDGDTGDKAIRLDATSTRLRLTTGNGYVDIGPQNSTYSHFQTDRGKFYFNKRLIVDEGIISSYNEDLILQRNSGSNNFRLTTNGSDTIIRHKANSYSAGFQTRHFFGNTMISNHGTETGTVYGFQISSTNFYPAKSGVSGLYRDNAVDLGHSSSRWDDIYATNGTIQTSDEREKQDIEALNEAEQRVAVAAKGLLRKFRWKDKVEAKGDDARIHFGIIAQDLEAAFIAEGLDPSKYAMFIKTEWWVGDKVYPAVEEETDEEGNVITEAVEESTDPEHHYDNQADAPADAVYHYRMGIRYSELLAFIISAI